MKSNETSQNYLEAIYILSLEKESIKAIDVVNYFGFSRPTVSVALKNLEVNGFIKIERYCISLTARGKRVAKDMYERHEYIAKVLMHYGVSKKIAYEDSCLIEHDLSEESFKAIKKATKNINIQ